jgi:glycerol kinase
MGILAIDQGTHATRAMLLDDRGAVLASHFIPVSLCRQGRNRVEQDPAEIAESVRIAIKKLLSIRSVRSHEIAAAGMATQRSSIVAWDRRNGNPLSPVLSWQDHRRAVWLNKIRTHSEKIKTINGLYLTPYYGASKMRWCLENLPKVRLAYRNGYLAIGPLASFLIFHLLKSNPVVVDHANAQRTQLFSLKSLNWDPWLCSLFGVPMELLPRCLPICHNYGILKHAQIPLLTVNGDQTAAFFSRGKPQCNTAVINIGSGAFVLKSTRNRLIADPELLSGIADSTFGKVEYVMEGTVNGASSALAWAAKKWNLPDPEKNLDSWLNQSGEVPIFINTIGGLGSPWWKPGPPAYLVGPEAPWQVAAGVLESILFMLMVNMEKIAQTGKAFQRIQISGGLSGSDGVCRRLSDLSQLPVYRPAETEATARGIAWLALGRPSRWPETGRGKWFHPYPNPHIQERLRKFRSLMDAL